jgi:hypothetical protein
LTPPPTPNAPLKPAALTGTVLWLRAARTAGAQPSLRTVSALGLALVPITLAGSLAALSA